MTSRVADETLTVAICSYNSAAHLPRLISSVAALQCPVPFEILLVDNNSTDETIDLIERMRGRSCVPLRYVHEAVQGIPFARNRAIKESLGRTYLAFIDSDELPDPGWLEAACRGLRENRADCVGGRIRLDLPNRPRWMTDSLLPFLGEVDYGSASMQVVDEATPVWSGNVAYRTRLFAGGLRFDSRYNRAGEGVGGGEDKIMFRTLLAGDAAIRYEPDMSIVHLIPSWKLTRRYFLKLHFLAGKKTGRFEFFEETGPQYFGVPRFMYWQLLKRSISVAAILARRNSEYLREAMNLTYHLGMMQGCRLRAKA